MISAHNNRSSLPRSHAETAGRKSASQTSLALPASRTASRRLYGLLAIAAVLIAGALWLRSSHPVREYLLSGRSLPELEAEVLQHPEDAVARYYLGKQYYLNRRFPEAQQAFHEAARLDPEWSRPHL